MNTKTKSVISGIVFIARNIYAARKVSEIKNEKMGNLLFRGYLPSDASIISEIYQKLNNGNIFSRVQHELYSRIGRRFMIVVEHGDISGATKIVGMNMYYLNRRDVKENTVHEGFIGVEPMMGGRGIATKMRQIAFQHFMSSNFFGISTRISLNNAASLNSAVKIGFQAVEEYREPSTGEQRYYMVCKF
jgi:RimJ/RimL family protein N-acetyltransferase